MNNLNIEKLQIGKLYKCKPKSIIIDGNQGWSYCGID